MEKLKNIIKSNIEKIRFTTDYKKRQIIIKETNTIFNKYFSVISEFYIGTIPTGNFIREYTDLTIENLYDEFDEVCNSTPVGIENF